MQAKNTDPIDHSGQRQQDSLPEVSNLPRRPRWLKGKKTTYSGRFTR